MKIQWRMGDIISAQAAAKANAFDELMATARRFAAFVPLRHGYKSGMDELDAIAAKVTGK